VSRTSPKGASRRTIVWFTAAGTLDC
jgi:hypothetical protein